jgi:hypothetical protein
MSKTILALCGVLLMASLATGCAVNSPGYAGSYGQNSDIAYIKATRGRADAHITKKQAQQYRLQQELVMREQRYEQLKRQYTLSNINSVLRGVQTVVNITRLLQR